MKTRRSYCKPEPEPERGEGDVLDMGVEPESCYMTDDNGTTKWVCTDEAC